MTVSCFSRLHVYIIIFEPVIIIYTFTNWKNQTIFTVVLLSSSFLYWSMLCVQCILKNNMQKLIRAQLLNALPIWGKYIPDKISQCLLIAHSCWLLGLKTEILPEPEEGQV